MKKCPYCAERIQDEAVICRYCGRDLPPVTPPSLVIHASPKIAGSRVILAFLLLPLTTWTFVITLLTILPDQPAYLGIGVFQLFLRILIGYLAVLDRNYQGQLPGWKKVLIFLLAFIPIGSWFAIYYAARSIASSTTAFKVLAGTFLLCVMIIFFQVVVNTLPGKSNAAIVGPTNIPDSTKLTATSTYRVPTRTPQMQLPNPFLKPTQSPPTTKCLYPGSVTADMKGKKITVCGKVTGVGGDSYYSYLMFSGDFRILSYDWEFDKSMKNECLMVSDWVELLGNEPVFVFGAGEGYAGSKCEIFPDGSKSCSSGDYFKAYANCR